jgi:hypothetical protein
LWEIPYERSLDDAVYAMPPNITWTRQVHHLEYPHQRWVVCWNVTGDAGNGETYESFQILLEDSANEILDRYRLAVACRMAIRKITQTSRGTFVIHAIKQIVCWMRGHRWRPESTLNIAVDQDIFDWHDDREPSTKCWCLRCGIERNIL